MMQKWVSEPGNLLVYHSGLSPPSCCNISLYMLLVCTKFNSSMNRKKRKDPAPSPSDARRWHMNPGANIVRERVGKQIIKYMPSWTAVRCVNSPWIQCRCVCVCLCMWAAYAWGLPSEQLETRNNSPRVALAMAQALAPTWPAEAAGRRCAGERGRY